MIELSLTNSEKKILVDEEIYEKIKGYKWSLRNSGYVRVKVKYKEILLHRFITKAKKGDYVDHINHNLLDNRLCNIRIGTQSQNLANTYPHRDKQNSIYKGVYYDKNTINNKRKKRWRVMICKHYKKMFVGRFHTEKEAVEEYNKKAKELWGEFAYQNKWIGETK